MERSEKVDDLNENDRYFEEQAAKCASSDSISRELYAEFGVKTGLRDENGKGVLTEAWACRQLTVYSVK